MEDLKKYQKILWENTESIIYGSELISAIKSGKEKVVELNKNLENSKDLDELLKAFEMEFGKTITLYKHQIKNCLELCRQGRNTTLKEKEIIDLLAEIEKLSSPNIEENVLKELKKESPLYKQLKEVFGITEPKLSAILSSKSLNQCTVIPELANELPKRNI